MCFCGRVEAVSLSSTDYRFNIILITYCADIFGMFCSHCRYMCRYCIYIWLQVQSCALLQHEAEQRPSGSTPRGTQRERRNRPLSLTSADDLVEVEQELLPGDHHVLHLLQQLRVQA